MTKPIIKYDSNGNLIYRKFSYCREWWREFYENGNKIHYKDSDGFKSWKENDKHNNNLFFLNTNNQIYWKKYPIFEEYHNEILFK
jgi:hypothetical protein